MSSIDTPVTAPPSSVTTAYWLYVVGAVLGLIGAVVVFVVLPSVIAQATSATGQALQGQDTNGVDVAGIATGAAIGSAVLSAAMTLVFSILTIVFARKMRQGRNWARIVLAVAAGLQIFGVLGPYASGPSTSSWCSPR